MNHEGKPVTVDDFRGENAWRFEDKLRAAVAIANMHGPGDGQQTPWEVVMEALIALKHDTDK